MESKRIAGVVLIMIPIVFWITTYIRYECAEGSCVINYQWLLIGALAILFGLVLLLSSSQEPILYHEQEDKKEKK